MSRAFALYDKVGDFVYFVKCRLTAPQPDIKGSAIVPLSSNLPVKCFKSYNLVSYICSKFSLVFNLFLAPRTIHLLNSIFPFAQGAIQTFSSLPRHRQCYCTERSGVWLSPSDITKHTTIGVTMPPLRTVAGAMVSKAVRVFERLFVQSRRGR